MILLLDEFKICVIVPITEDEKDLLTGVFLESSDNHKKGQVESSNAIAAILVWIHQQFFTKIRLKTLFRV